MADSFATLSRSISSRYLLLFLEVLLLGKAAHASMGGGGTLPEASEIWTHICSCHNFFPPFFCADTFDTSLLLVVCALRWYVKSLYRHIFLEDISNHARVTQKMTLPNLWQELFPGALTEAAQNWSLEEAGSQKLHGLPRNFCDPASSQHHNSGPVHVKKEFFHTITATCFS